MRVANGAVLLAVAVSVGAQQGPSVQSLKWDETKQIGSAEVFDPGQPAARWRLADFNRTRVVLRAYRTGSLLVVIGDMTDSFGEIVTIIDAVSKQEKMEFLCYDAAPSSSGLQIAFRHFYPHFGSMDVSDRLQVVDLSRSVPNLLPSAGAHIPEQDVGVTVYPQANLPVGQKHRLSNFVWSNNDSSIFLVDRIEKIEQDHVEPGKLCLARVDRVASTSPIATQHCLTPGEAGNPLITLLQPDDFRRGASGELVLTIDLTAESGEPTKEDFTVDPATLAISVKPSQVASALQIPWIVQKKQLIGFVPLGQSAGLASLQHDLVGIKLTINKDGTVESGQVSDSLPDDVVHAVEAAIAQWRFRGTILDGVPIKVVTAFETELGDLQNPDWAERN